MTTLKSRGFECPDDLMIAVVNLDIAKTNLINLARKLVHQSCLINDDVTVTILNDTADEIERYTAPLDAMTDELSVFLTSLE